MNVSTNASWYDVLDVDPAATTDEVRAAWRTAVADLDPTSRRFRLYNEAAEVLLDPERRARYDAAQLAAEQEPPTPTDPPTALDAESSYGDSARGEKREGSRRRLPLVPGWLLVGVAALVALALVGVGVLLTKPADASVAADTQAAQAAAERAIVPILSYDAHHLDRSEAAATAYMTDDEKQQYQKLFAVVRQNAPRLGTVIKARYVASGVVRSGTDRVDVLVFVDQVTRNKAHPDRPVIFKNQVTVTMAKVGGTWLVDDLTTSRG
jgi:Mce-associated membrane protein